MGLTVNWKLLLVVAKPSLTVTVILAVPVFPASGVTVTVRFAPLPPKTMLAFGTSAEFEAVPTRVRFAAGVSVSLTTNELAGVGVPGLVLRLARAEIVGAWLTVTVKERVTMLLLEPPSLTVTVIVVEPLAEATGVKDSEPVELALR